MSEFRILTVCTANICRSPLTAHLLAAQARASLPPTPGPATEGSAASPGSEVIRTGSAGVAALPGYPACDVTTALLLGAADGSTATPDQDRPAAASEESHSPTDLGAELFRATAIAALPAQQAHVSRPVSRELLGEADLILALDRGHRGELAKLLPAARPRTFTLRQAAALAGYVADQLSAGHLPEGAPAMPPADAPADRLRWFVGEMDAARGLAEPTSAAAIATQKGREDAPPHPLDIHDPHVVGFQFHPDTFRLISAATQELTRGMRSALTFPDA